MGIYHADTNTQTSFCRGCVFKVFQDLRPIPQVLPTAGVYVVGGGIPERKTL